AEYVFDGRTRRHSSDHESRRGLDGQVLVAVHGDVDVTVAKRPLDRRGEKPGTLDLPERLVRDLIALGADFDDVDGQVGRLRPELRGNELALPSGERAAARAQPREAAHDVSSENSCRRYCACAGSIGWSGSPS